MSLREDIDRLASHADADGSWGRSAAFLARQALEEAIYQRLHGEFGMGRETSFRAQLIALRQAIDPALAAEVAWAWTALSSATHAHGYALPPTIEELHRWVETVERLHQT